MYKHKIIDWVIDRNLHKQDPRIQMLKMTEEVGELASGLARGNKELIEDSIGDCYVVLVALCTQLNIDLDDCVSKAYEEIKDRKGKLVDGVFVKDGE